VNDSLRVEGLDFEIRRSGRRKTLGLTVGRASELIVHVPEETAPGEMEKWVRRKLLWVHQKLALKKESAPRETPPEFVSGQVIHFLGRSYRLKLKAAQREPLIYTGDEFHLSRSHEAGAEALFQKWFMQEGTDWLTRRVAHWAPRVGESPKKIVVGNLGFRWGSCSRGGRLNFNWRVLQLPVGLADYVLVHEMIHLRERHHGPEFWEMFGRVMPDYRQREVRLRLRASEFLVFDILKPKD
jgi:predicted metal-dependent hydrolase